MPAHPAFNNFTAGELTPQLDARTDLAKYGTGVKTMENLRPLPWGGATMRPGTVQLGATKFGGARMCRLIPFNYSTTDSFVIEFGHKYMRFWSGQLGAIIAAGSFTSISAWALNQSYVPGNFVTNGGTTYYCLVAVSSGSFATQLAANDWVAQTAYEIITPFQEADLFQIQRKEINDVVYFSHPNYPVQKLSRLADDNWTIGEPSWTWPAMMDQNTVLATTITPSAKTGAITLASSAAIWNSSHVGSYFEIDYEQDAQDVSIGLSSSNTGTTPFIVIGAWTILTAGTWSGTVAIERSYDGGSTYTTIRVYTGNNNILDSGVEATPAAGQPYAMYRLVTVITDHNGSPAADFRTTNCTLQGLVKITGYTNSTAVAATVINTLFGTAATPLWAEGAWSAYRGYPRAVGLFQQRLMFAGTASAPTTVWLSASGDFESFLPGDLATDTLTYQIAAAEQDPIQWLEAITSIHAGTSGSEQAITSGSSGEPLTPTNIGAWATSDFGCNYLQPVRVERKVLFLERQGRRLREMGEVFIYANPDSVMVPDLTMLAEHVTQSGITQMDFAHLPDPLIYLVRGDGQIAVLTYNREQQITAWGRFVTQGLFESVACIYNTPQDQVWVVANRVVGGITQRFIERFTSFFDPTSSPGASAIQASATALLPCNGSDGAGFCYVAGGASQKITIGGDPGKMYRVTMRVCGVAENQAYSGGTALNGWYLGGAPVSITNNVFALTVSNPPATYYLNSTGSASGETTRTFDYTNTITVAGGSTIRISGTNQQAFQASNGSNLSATAPVIGVTQPYAGQFMQVQLTNLSDPTVLPVQNNTIFFVDCGQALFFAVPTASITGLNYLAGCTVSVLADGVPYTGLVVSGTGTLTLPVAASAVNVGLPYVGTLETMKIDSSGQDGTTQGRRKAIGQFVIRFKDTGAGVQFLATPPDGGNQGAAEVLAFRRTSDAMDAALPLFTGEKALTWPGGANLSQTIKVQQTLPLPMTVLALFPQVSDFTQ